MYQGSMIGKGALYFAVWGYVISHFVPSKKLGATVELNPKLIALLLGEDADRVAAVISDMCGPDPESNTPDEEGRKLVQLGHYEYRVVNGAKYRAVRDHEERKAQVREAQRRFREKEKSEDLPDGTQKKRSEVPSIEEIMLAAAKIGLPEIEARKFHAFYESKGWMVGKTKMKSVAGAMAGWKLRNQSNGNQYTGEKRVDRSIGTANEGKAHLYKGLGQVPPDGNL